MEGLRSRASSRLLPSNYTVGSLHQGGCEIVLICQISAAASPQIGGMEAGLVHRVSPNLLRGNCVDFALRLLRRGISRPSTRQECPSSQFPKSPSPKGLWPSVHQPLRACRDSALISGAQRVFDVGNGHQGIMFPQIVPKRN